MMLMMLMVSFLLVQKVLRDFHFDCLAWLCRLSSAISAAIWRWIYCRRTHRRFVCGGPLPLRDLHHASLPPRWPPQPRRLLFLRSRTTWPRTHAGNEAGVTASLQPGQAEIHPAAQGLAAPRPSFVGLSSLRPVPTSTRFAPEQPLDRGMPQDWIDRRLSLSMLGTPLKARISPLA